MMRRRSYKTVLAAIGRRSLPPGPLRGDTRHQRRGENHVDLVPGGTIVWRDGKPHREPPRSLR